MAMNAQNIFVLWQPWITGKTLFPSYWMVVATLSQGSSNLVCIKKQDGYNFISSYAFQFAWLIARCEDLSSLVLPFTEEEIEAMVKHMPSDKAPGLDGFNGMFMKKCWNIIKQDVYKLCQDFYDCVVDLTPINTSFITLVPKVSSLEQVNDYRPISLLNSIIITKILVDRLQLVILELIHLNHYGFLRSRTIQDCLAWSFQYIHQCH